MRISPKSVVHVLAGFVCLAASGWLVVITGNALAPLELARPRLLSPPPLVEMDAKVIDVVTMGHRGLYDDFIDIWAIQILMDESLRKEKPDDVADALHRITRQAPKLESLYMLTCFVLAMDFERPDLCLRITMDGLAAFPESWRIPVTQAAIYAFRMNRPGDAAPFFMLASLRPKAPGYLGSLARKLRDKAALTAGDIDQLEYLDELPGGKRLKELMIKDNARRSAQP